MAKPKSKQHNRQHAARAASFKRLAKSLRIYATNYRNAAKIAAKQDDPKAPARAAELRMRAAMHKDIAVEFDNEARTLRAMR